MLFSFNLLLNTILFYSGYLFTRESLRRIVEIGFHQNLCSTFNLPGAADDMILGNLLNTKSKSVSSY